LPISPHQDEEAHIEASTKFEAWAVGMLGECPQSAAAALIEGHTARWHMSLLQLALSGHSKRFIAHEQYAALTSPQMGPAVACYSRVRPLTRASAAHVFSPPHLCAVPGTAASR
tara:strand:+ start:97 stop:438 length:342 start_codon:yes stop_codon:yes gene_type:complete